MADNRLLPCLCGGEAYVKSAISLDDLSLGHVVISCSRCSMTIQGQTIAQAIIRWNQKVVDGRK